MTARSPVQALPTARFPLAQMLGAGDDGAAYVGFEGPGGRRVVVHRLKKPGFERRRWFEQRLKKRRMLEGPLFVDLVYAELDGDEPTLVVERIEGTLAQLISTEPLERDVALKLIHSLAQALVKAHRIGMPHGALSPASVFVREDMTAAIELMLPETGAFAADSRCRAPDAVPSAASDLYSLGAVMSLALTGAPPPTADETATGVHGAPKDETRVLIKELMDLEPSWRPTAEDALDRIGHLLQSAVAASPDAPTLNPKGEPTQLGRFKIDALLGRGAMGRVYRATDLSDGTKVALKLLDGASAGSLSALRRFRKEARLLAEVNNPYIANLIETNRDQGLYFMAVELIEGKDLSAQLKEKGPFPEAEAIAIAASVARALVEVHARGVIHRDIKPANIITFDEPSSGGKPGGSKVKLIDFGIARHIDEHASLQLTEAGASIGTPVYMSPEQCKGGTLDPKTDVYSLGVTLFALVAGKPPFSGGESPEAIFSRHLFEAAPMLCDVEPKASRELSALLLRCLEKDPKNRPDAATLVEELDRLSQTGTTRFSEHPVPPKNNGTVTYRFEWSLKSPPHALWAYVSNTDRLNRAIGLGPVEESFKTVEGEVQRHAKAPQFPFTLKWREHPFEWVQGKRLGVLRELEDGPLHWFRSMVDLEASPTGGTHLTHTIELEPRGVMGRAAAAVEIGVRTRLALSRVYQRIDELLAQPADQPSMISDAFEERFTPTADALDRLSAIEKKMIDSGADLVATARLGDFLRYAPAPEVARIRPLALARRLRLQESQLVATCLWAAKEGALVLAWDLICPSCRIPSQMKDTLRAVKEHGRCEVCSIDYALDLASSIELVFSVSPELRASDRSTYCLGSPGHSPHVVAQVRVKPGERFELRLELADGRYAFTGRGLGYKLDFKVGAGATALRWELDLSKGLAPGETHRLSSGAQTMVLHNDTDKEQLVRVEKTVSREDALTAARVAALPLFRRLFPLEVLAPGQLVNVSNVALLMVEVAPGASDAKTDTGSFASRYALFRRLEELASAHGGAVVKIAGDGVVAVFSDVASAVRAAITMGHDPLPLRVAVHKGPAAAVTLDEHLDYFGRTVRETSRLLACGAERELVLSEAAASDPQVRPLTAEREASIDVTLGVPCQRIVLG